MPEGQIIALNGEAGYQAELLRGGIHFGYWRWQYRVHKVRLVTISQGKIGYVYARDGEPLPPSQTLGQRGRLQQLPGRARVPRRHDARGWPRLLRPAGPAAGDPARRRVRHQPGAVRRDRRRPCVRAAVDSIAAGAADDRAVSRTSCRRCGGFDPVVIGGKIDIGRRARAGSADDGRLARHRDGARRSVAAAGRDHRADRRHAMRRSRTSTTTSRTPRRFCAPAAAAAGSTRRSPTARTSSTAGSPRWR